MTVREGENLNDIDFSDKTLQGFCFTDCKFNGCKFRATTLKSVVFNECAFENCIFANAVFDGCEMKFCTFKSATLIGVNWAAISPEFAYAIEKAERCLFKFNTFENVSLKKINFGQSEILSSTFNRANLAECDFSGCNLDGSSFTDCDLQKSDFKLSRGFDIDVATCKLKGAKFSFANLPALVKSLGVKIS